MQNFTTMEEAIEYYKNQEINYRGLHRYMNLCNKQTNDTITIPIDSVMNKYRYFLKDIVNTVELTDREWLMYRFKPKMVSYRLYGTTEFWHALLRINGCKSVIDFDLKKIKIYDQSRLNSMLNEILIIDDMLD